MYRTLSLVLSAFFLCMAAVTFGIADEQPKGITVTATGEVKAKPDIAYVTLGVITQSAEAATAAEENANKTTAVIAALSEAGIRQPDIETTGYSVSPVMDYRKSPAVTVGYNVSNQVRITIRDLTRIGSLIDIAINAGANNVQNVVFSVENDSTIQRKALTEAVFQAQIKARTMAEAAGVKLGKVIAISEAGGYIPRPMLATAAKMESATTPIIPGELTATASVTIVYAIL